MTPASTEKVYFGKKNTIKNRITEKKTNPTGRITRKKNTRKNKAKLDRPQFFFLFVVFLFFVFSCFWFSCLFFCLLCFFYETPYSLCCWTHTAY
jgi:hypothetical protein